MINIGHATAIIHWPVYPWAIALYPTHAQHRVVYVLTKNRAVICGYILRVAVQIGKIMASIERLESLVRTEEMNHFSTQYFLQDKNNCKINFMLWLKSGRGAIYQAAVKHPIIKS